MVASTLYLGERPKRSPRLTKPLATDAATVMKAAPVIAVVLLVVIIVATIKVLGQMQHVPTYRYYSPTGV